MARRYWRVKLTETIGGQTVEGWVRFIPANSAQEAREKAVRYVQKKMPGANPSIVGADEELQAPFGRVITLPYLDEAANPPLDSNGALALD